jgi:hypothetical protein
VTKSWRRWVALGLTSFVAATALPAHGAVTQERKFSLHQHDDWEPAIAADDRGHVYWATTRYGGAKACRACPDPAIVYRHSSNNGLTWSKPLFLCKCPGVEGQHDPVLAVDDSGRLFATWMNNYEVSFARSDDFGVTWTRWGSLDGVLRWSDKPWIGVSGDGEDVYMTFNGPGTAPGTPYAVYSHNAGETWSSPIPTRRNKHYWFASGATVTPDGTVFIAQAVYGQKYTGAVLLFVQRSTDGGRTWNTIGIDRSAQARRCPPGTGCTLGYFGPQIATTSDDRGRVYVAWNASRRRSGLSNLFVRWTDDDGETWSLPHKVEATEGRVDHQFPMLAATGDGDVRLAWMDNRTGRWNTWYRRSTNGGASWSPAQKLSNRPGGAPYKRPGGFLFPYGDYGMLAIDSDGNTHATWGEGPSYEGPGGSWHGRAL